ncbi:hypothetical protein MM213_06425 [Belliella sp. R4-6]|uniref:Lipocalin-like domain-containing protein n=1 Tax=Belliella alkalica TaxID=1730871 RepID=A0ABS9VAZ9_9BACT|nr:hypothetical protein [Belliella alkalica]MCH7413110.1 hypothetical protein [Belliella alkalica]
MKAAKLLVIAGMVFLIASCGIVDGFGEKSLSGYYEGTFERFVDGNSEGIAEVSLNFEGFNYNGLSEEPRYPVICSGNYSIKRKTISFSNTCNFTADFDWTLILNGDWRIEENDDNLILSRSEGQVVDWYRLKKVE